jgi:osmotically inducible lipoprotein OsmB
MKTLTRWTLTLASTAALIASTGCADMTHREKSTAVGAGVGAVAGSVLTGGNAIGTVGGAVAGGVVGNEVGKRR